ncbi:MAG: hypothetical protein LBD29_00410, partial [Treponema sp.]|nr:hypothetical protein [Treponema sp.]
MTKTNLLWKILVLCITMGGGISLIFTGCPTEAESDEDESGNEPKPGIYMEPGSIQFTGDEDHPFNLAAAFAWLKENALLNTHYRLILGE